MYEEARASLSDRGVAIVQLRNAEQMVWQLIKKC